MNDTTRTTAMRGEDDLERELRVYAAARLTPDRLASTRMRAAVLEHARVAETLAMQPPAPSAMDRLRLAFRRLALVGGVTVVAITAGTATAFAASPGGPLYGVRLQIETAFLPAGGEARADAQIGLLTERTNEITDALQAGDDGGADAAASAYSDQIDQALANAAAQRADLLDLQTTLQRQLAHFRSLTPPNDKAAANLQHLIAKTQAALAAVNAKLAALPSPAP